MSVTSSAALRGVGFGVLAVAAATLLRRLLDPLLGTQVSYSTLYVALLATAWYAGFRAALGATLAGAIAAIVFLLPSRAPAEFRDPSEVLGFALFLVTGLCISALGGAMHHARRRAEANAATSARRAEESSAILASIGDAVFALDPSGRVIVANRAASRLLELGTSPLEGRPIEQVLARAALDPQDADAIARAAASGGSSRNGEDPTVVRIRHPDAGRERELEYSLNPIRGESGASAGAVLLLRDVTDRRKLEALQRDMQADLEREVSRRTSELRKVDERFRLLVDGLTGHSIFLLDAKGIIQTWNAGAERIDGYSSAEVVEKDFAMLFPAADVARGRHTLELQRAAESGGIEVEGWRVRKDGSRYWAGGTISALYDTRGSIRAFAKITRDLTQRRRTDQLLRSVLDHTIDGIISIDESGIVTLVNSAGESLFQHTAAEIVGHNVKLLMPEPYRSEHDSYLANYIRTGVAKVIGIGREVRGQRKDGSTFPMDLAISEFELGGHRHFVGIVRDVSERKRLEEQLRQSQKMEAVGQLAGGVAHDFNNLLTIILGYSEALLESTDPDDRRRAALSDIRNAGERAAALTRQLLAFSRRQALAPRVLDVNGIVHDTEKMLRRLIGEDVRLATALANDLQPVLVDPGQLAQVLVNLAVNARDAMPDGGRLTIETRNVELDEAYAVEHADARPGKFVQIAISDTGSGMTPEVRRRLFEPFFTTKGMGKGTGLGLAVVHGIVKQSGGNIEVYSEPGVGTAFKIHLPVTERTATSDETPLMRVALRGGETIVLVEDHGPVRDFAAEALRQFGYTILVANGGRDALARLDAHSGAVDLLVTDIVMPDMNGRVLADHVRMRRPGIKVLFLSGYAEDAIVRHGILGPDVAFLQKPFTATALARRVREVLEASA